MSIAHPSRIAVGRTRFRPERSRVISWGVATAVLLSAAAATAQLVDYGAFDLRIRALDSNTHASIFGVISLLVLVAAVVAAAVGAAVDGERRTRSMLLAVLLGVVLGFRVVHPAHVVLLSAPVTALVFALLWWSDYADATTRRVIRAGCLLLAGSLIVHRFGFGVVSGLGYDRDSWAYQVKIVIRHDLELAGWVLVATGLAARALGTQRRAASTAAATLTTP